ERRVVLGGRALVQDGFEDVLHVSAPASGAARPPRTLPTGNRRCHDGVTYLSSRGAGSTSSTSTPPASLGCTKFTRLPDVPRRGSSYSSRSPRSRSTAETCSTSVT